VLAAAEALFLGDHDLAVLILPAPAAVVAIFLLTTQHTHRLHKSTTVLLPTSNDVKQATHERFRRPKFWKRA
jgi:2-phospho-L-lactate transferase/gluconeogenesis factor (CofD/UPF0052 family)